MREADLSDADLKHADLSDADLSGATLVDANLFYANLMGADLEGADLTEAYLAQADLTYADLEGATLTDASLSGADFTEGFLRDADLTDTILRGADFTNAYLDPADITGADLRETGFQGADLEAATLKDANLFKANLTNADLRDADLTGAVLERAVLTRADLFGATLAGAFLEGALFADVHLNEATFRNMAREETGAETRSLHRRLRAVVHGPTGTDTFRCPYDPELPEAAATDGGDTTPELRAAAVYRQLEQLARRNAFPDWERRFFILRQDMQTRQYRREGAWTKHKFAALQRTLFGFGESFRRVLGWSGATIVLFALIYLVSGSIRPVTPTGDFGQSVFVARLPTNPGVIWDSLYYSTLTFTSLGFGDYRPVTTVGQVVTVAETAIGAVLLALLVFVLGRRAAR